MSAVWTSHQMQTLVLKDNYDGAFSLYRQVNGALQNDYPLWGTLIVKDNKTNPLLSSSHSPGCLNCLELGQS